MDWRTHESDESNARADQNLGWRNWIRPHEREENLDRGDEEIEQNQAVTSAKREQEEKYWRARENWIRRYN
jgi:hypothetical protein